MAPLTAFLFHLLVTAVFFLPGAQSQTVSPTTSPTPTLTPSCFAAPGSYCQFLLTSGATGTAVCPIGTFCPGGLTPPQVCGCPGFCTSGLSTDTSLSVSATSWKVTTLAGNGSNWHIDGPPGVGTLCSPAAIAVHPLTSLVYVGEFCTTYSAVRTVTPTGTVGTLAGGGGGTCPTGDGLGSLATFWRISGMVLDSGAGGSGNLYVSDQSCHNVRRVTPAGAVTTIAGGAAVGVSTGSGVGAAFRFNRPMGLAVAGNFLYVSDQGSNRVLRVTLSTGAVASVLGLTTYLATPTGIEGAQGVANYNNPNGLAFDASGNLLVMDSYNCRMRRALAGTFVSSTIVGLNGSVISSSPPGVDGQGLGARLYYPGPLFADTSGYWFTQPFNQLVKRISLDLTVTSIAGGTSGTTDGIGAAARFSQPLGIASDLYGNVYIADGNPSNAVRKITCKACAAGYYCSSTGTATVCPLGSFCPSGSSSPTPCGMGTYSPVVGASAPCTLECPSGAWCPAGTGMPIFCPPGSYSDTPGQTEGVACTPCTAAPGWHCPAGSSTPGGVLCPAGSFCTGGAAPAMLCTCPGLCSTPGAATEITIASPTVWSVATIAGAGAPGSLDGMGRSASFSGPRGIALAPDGSTMVVADSQNSLLRSVYLNGTVATLCGTRGLFTETDGGCSTGAVLYYTASLAFNPLGYAIVADVFGYRIRLVSPSGIASTLAGSSNGYADGASAMFRGPSSVSLSSTGVVYITDSQSCTIRALWSNASVTTIAGIDLVSTPFFNGPRRNATFNQPQGAALDPTTLLSLYVADTNNHRIRHVSLATGFTSTLAGSGVIGSVDGLGTAATFTSPVAITVHSGGALFVSDGGVGLLRRITPLGQVTTLLGSPRVMGVRYMDGPGSLAALWSSYGSAFGSLGRLYLTGQQSNAVRAVTCGACPAGYWCAGSAVRLCPAGTWGAPGQATAACSGACTASPGYHCPAGSQSSGGVQCPPGSWCAGGAAAPAPCQCGGACPAGSSSDGTTGAVLWTAGLLAGNASVSAGDGPLLSSSFSTPSDIVFDGAGNGWVADQVSCRIRKISLATGIVSGQAGNGMAFSGDGWPGSNYINNPKGVTLDPYGVLYISDSNANKIRALGTEVTYLSTIAGSGVAGSANGIGVAAQFSNPGGLAYSDPLGALYVADTNSNMVRQIILGTGVVTTFAGSGVAGFLDGTGAAARFSGPTSLSVNPSNGNLIVCDRVNSVVRMITPLGVVTTVGGTAGTTTPITDGLWSSALNLPNALTVDRSGAVWITDSGNFRVRRLGNNSLLPALPSSLVSLAGNINAYTNNLGNLAGLGSIRGLSFYNGTLYITDTNRVRSLTCTLCPAGSFCAYTLTGAGMGVSPPAPCPAGSYCPIGTRTPTPCPQGTYSGATGATSLATCTPTPAGFYSPQGSEFPLQCPPGVFSSGPGASTPACGGLCTAAPGWGCPAGWLGGGGGSPCSPGFFCPGGSVGPTACTCPGACSAPTLTYDPWNSSSSVGGVVWSSGVFAGSGTAGSLDGLGGLAQFNTPMGFAVAGNGSGRLWVGDIATGNIKVRTVMGGLAGPYELTWSAGASSLFSVAFPSATPLPFAPPAGTIFQFSILPGGGTFTGIPGTLALSTNYYVVTSVTSVNAVAPTPTSFSFSTALGGAVYTITQSLVPPTTPGAIMFPRAVATRAGSTVTGYGDAVGTAATFTTTMSLASDRADNLFVFDSRLRMLAPNGSVTTWGPSAALFTANSMASVFGIASYPAVVPPVSLTTGFSGVLYISDYSRFCVRRMTNAGMTTVAGVCQATGGYVDGPLGVGQLLGPRGVALDPLGQGNLYIADFLGHRIRYAFANGTLVTLVGNGTATSVDGPANSALVNSTSTFGPNFIAVDTALNVYWVERWGGKVRRLDAGTRMVYTLAGTSVITVDVNGYVTSSAFNLPWSLTLDPGSNALYVLQFNTGNKISKVSCGLCPAGFTCTSPFSAPVACVAGGFCPTGSGVRTPCPPGAYCPAQSVNYTLCPAGVFGNTTGLPTPSCAGPCDGGFYCPVGSVTSQAVICPVGSFCPPGSATPTPCPCPASCSTPGLSAAPSCSSTLTPTQTPSPGSSMSTSPTFTPSRSRSGTVSGTRSPSRTPSGTRSGTPSFTTSRTQTPSATPSPTLSPTQTLTPSPSKSLSPTSTITASITLSSSGTPSQTPAPVGPMTACASTSVCLGPTVQLVSTQSFNFKSATPYAENTNYFQVVAPPPGYRVSLSFTGFNTESGFDYVIIYPSTAGPFQVSSTAPTGTLVVSTSGTCPSCVFFGHYGVPVVVQLFSDPSTTLSGIQVVAQCSPCPAGSYCANATSSAQICPVGHFCPLAAVAPTLCTNGCCGSTGLASQASCSATPSMGATVSSTPTPSRTQTRTGTTTPSVSGTAPPTPSGTPSPTPSKSGTAAVVGTQPRTPTGAPSLSRSVRPSASGSRAPTLSPSRSPLLSGTKGSLALLPSNTASPLPTGTNRTLSLPTRSVSTSTTTKLSPTRSPLATGTNRSLPLAPGTTSPLASGTNRSLPLPTRTVSTSATNKLSVSGSPLATGTKGSLVLLPSNTRSPVPTGTNRTAPLLSSPTTFPSVTFNYPYPTLSATGSPSKPLGTRSASPSLSTTTSVTQTRSVSPTLSISPSAQNKTGGGGFAATLPSIPTVTVTSVGSLSPSVSRCPSTSSSTTPSPSLTTTTSVTQSESRSPSLTFSPSAQNKSVYSPPSLPTLTLTSSPSLAWSESGSASASTTPSALGSWTPTVSVDPSLSPSPSTSTSPTQSPKVSNSTLPSLSSTRSGSFSRTTSGAPSASRSASASSSSSFSSTPTPTMTPTGTPSRSGTRTANVTGTPSGTQSPTGSGTLTGSATGSDTTTPSATPTSSVTPTASPSVTGSTTPSPTGSPTTSLSVGASASNTGSISSTPSNTPSFTPTATPSATTTQSGSDTPSRTPSATPSATATSTVSSSQSPTSTLTASSSVTPSGTPTSSASPTGTLSIGLSPSVTPTASGSPSTSGTPSLSGTPTLTPTTSGLG